jgi:tetratricopeptide (TPR) repeat protein
MTPQKTGEPGQAPFGLRKTELDAIEVLGFELYQQGRYKEADAIFDGLIVLNRTMYRGYAGKGALALADERLEEALSWLSQAAERNTADPTVHANLGETLLRMGRFKEAAAELERALALDPNERDPAANRARAILSGMSTIVRDRETSPPGAQLSEPRSR